MSREQAWHDWLTHNIAQNCLPEQLRSLLIENGFSDNQADESMLRANLEVEKRQLKVKTNETQIDADQAIYLPHALKMENARIEMYGVDGFLTADENIQLIELIRHCVCDSFDTSEETQASNKTTKTCKLATLKHPLVEEIDQRICRYMGIDPGESEPIEGQWLEAGQESVEHTDYLDSNGVSCREQVHNLGKRTWTFMIYLNTVTVGGETKFNEIDLSVEPLAGTALIWNNLDSQGQPNKATTRCEMPLRSDYKAVITKWFRSIDGIPRYKKKVNEFLKPLTQSGFLKLRVPEPLYSTLVDFYNTHRCDSTSESVPGYISNKVGKVPSVLVELTDELRQSVHKTLQPLVEAWIGSYLEHTYVYGIREYHQGAILKEHRDRLKTHIAGVIINIDQVVKHDWPLIIEDHFYRRHSVLLKPGEMVFYESARLKHGRPDMLDGERYANVFVHFKNK